MFLLDGLKLEDSAAIKYCRGLRPKEIPLMWQDGVCLHFKHVFCNSLPPDVLNYSFQDQLESLTFGKAELDTLQLP